jgi:hypothetical protein
LDGSKICSSVKPLVLAAFKVTRKEGLCPSSGGINRLIVTMMNFLFISKAFYKLLAVIN